MVWWMEREPLEWFSRWSRIKLNHPHAKTTETMKLRAVCPEPLFTLHCVGQCPRVSYSDRHMQSLIIGRAGLKAGEALIRASWCLCCGQHCAMDPTSPPHCTACQTNPALLHCDRSPSTACLPTCSTVMLLYKPQTKSRTLFFDV